jgi:hypothetical protein
MTESAKEKVKEVMAIIEGRGIADNRNVARPTYYQKQTEREGRSEWSGGNMGGGTWGGRSRGEREQP